jgi:hypothetical protein
MLFSPHMCDTIAMPEGPQGQKRRPDVIGNAVDVMRSDPGTAYLFTAMRYARSCAGPHRSGLSESSK